MYICIRKGCCVPNPFFFLKIEIYYFLFLINTKNTKKMDEKEINHYENGKYYSYDGELYTRTFPHHWAMNHANNTGPKKCLSCAKFGSWNGVFVSYCVNCANEYRGQRGNGVYIYERMCEINTHNRNAAFNTYLYGIDFDNIGNKEMLDSEQMYRIHYTDFIDRELNIRIALSFDYNNNIELPHS